MEPAVSEDEPPPRAQGGRGRGRGGRGRGRGRGGGRGTAASKPEPDVAHVLLSDGTYACGFPEGEGRDPFKNATGLKIHLAVKHRASKRPFVVVSEDEARGSGLSPAGAGPAARRARRAASAAVGEASLGEVGDDDAGDADPSAGLDEDESDDDGAFEMRPTTVGPDADATRDSSSDDERDSEREQTARAPRAPRRARRLALHPRDC